MNQAMRVIADETGLDEAGGWALLGWVGPNGFDFSAWSERKIRNVARESYADMLAASSICAFANADFELP